MGSDLVRALRATLPLIPLAVRISICHMLGISESAKYLDLRTALFIALVRALVTPSRPISISASQRMTMRDPGVKGRIWVSRYTAPVPPETAALDVILDTIRRLAAPEPGQSETQPQSQTHSNSPIPSSPSASSSSSAATPDHPKTTWPALAAVEAEWTGFRPAAARGDQLPPGATQQQLYHDMMQDVTHPATILYFHGGGYFLCDPATHRAVTKKLAKVTGGRCYSVRYRLAPQHPFPAALVDAFMSYLTLLYPPPGAFHEPVLPEHIVFAGDSAGGNLSLALLQLLLELRRQDTRVLWHGQLRDLPLPAGVATNSPMIDSTFSSPNWEDTTPTPYDYLPKPASTEGNPAPPCAIWPASPARRSLHVANSLAAHPLASLSMARSWKGAPPIYLCTGWEILAYEDRHTARRLHDEGVRVVFEEYEAMPHCFALVLNDGGPMTQRCYSGWGGFVRDVVDDAEAVVSRAVTVKAKTLQEKELQFADLSDADVEEVRRRILAWAPVSEPVPMLGEQVLAAKL